LKEEEIRPADLFAEYLRLAEQDAKEYFPGHSRQLCLCPACGQPGQKIFSKQNLDYEECPGCQTLFASPRPPAGELNRYYRESPSARFFGTTFYRATSEARRLKLWRPKAEKVLNLLHRHGADEFHLIDIGGGYGIFAKEFERLSSRKVLVVEPGPDSAAACRQQGLQVVESFLEDLTPGQLPPGPKAFVSFELFEHLHHPGLFLDQLGSMMNPGDLFLFTTLNGMGLDIQVLWEKSNSFSLQHLQFLNPWSIRLLLKKCQFESLVVETPGKLDMDILKKNQGAITDRFWKKLLGQAEDQTLDQWQEFISSQGFSSHMWVLCRRGKGHENKPTAGVPA